MKRLPFIPRNSNTRNKYNVLMLHYQNYFREHSNSIYSLAQVIPENKKSHWFQLRIQPKLAIISDQDNKKRPLIRISAKWSQAKIGFNITTQHNYIRT